MVHHYHDSNKDKRREYLNLHKATKNRHYLMDEDLYIHRHSRPFQPNRIALQIPSRIRPVIPVKVVMRLRFLVVILPRESQAHLNVPLDDLCCAKALCDGLPAHSPFFCRRQYGRSQMVRVQPVITRLWVRQAAAWRFGLPHRVGAPQAQRWAATRFRPQALVICPCSLAFFRH